MKRFRYMGDRSISLGSSLPFPLFQKKKAVMGTQKTVHGVHAGRAAAEWPDENAGHSSRVPIVCGGIEKETIITLALP